MTTSFNGAAPVRTRIVHRVGGHRQLIDRFNGAAPVRTRIAAMSLIVVSASCIASMGPRL